MCFLHTPTPKTHAQHPKHFCQLTHTHTLTHKDAHTQTLFVRYQPRQSDCSIPLEERETKMQDFLFAFRKLAKKMLIFYSKFENIAQLIYYK